MVWVFCDKCERQIEGPVIKGDFLDFYHPLCWAELTGEPIEQTVSWLNRWRFGIRRPKGKE